MKTMISLLTLLSIFLTYSMNSKARAQKQKDSVIVLNFKTKKFDKNPYYMKFKEGDLYQFKITGINMNLYKVTIEGKDSCRSNTNGASIFNTLSIESIMKASADLSQFVTVSKQSALKVKNLPNGIKLNNTLLPLQEKEDLSIIIWQSIDSFTIALNQISKKIEKYNILIDSLKMSVYLKKTHYQLENTNIKTNQYLNIHNLAMEIQPIQIKVGELIMDLSNRQSDYEKFAVKYKSEIEKDKEIQKVNQKLSDTFKSIKNSCEDLHKAINADAVNDWITSLINFENNSTSEFLSLPLQHKNDYSILHIKIVPKSDNFELPTYQTSVTFSGQPHLYVGVGTSFYFSWLRNDSYSIRSTRVNADSTNYSIINEKPLKNEIGIATLVYLGYKFENNNIGFHFSFGPAIPINSATNPRLTLGAGVSLGNRQKFTLNFLGIGGYTNRLSNKYSENTIYTSIPEQVTVSKLQIKFSIAVGYAYIF